MIQKHSFTDANKLYGLLTEKYGIEDNLVENLGEAINFADEAENCKIEEIMLNTEQEFVMVALSLEEGYRLSGHTKEEINYGKSVITYMDNDKIRFKFK